MRIEGKRKRKRKTNFGVSQKKTLVKGRDERKKRKEEKERGRKYEVLKSLVPKMKKK